MTAVTTIPAASRAGDRRSRSTAFVRHAAQLVASLVLAGSQRGTLATVLGTIAVACATANVVGGFLITDRMLAMFKRAGAPTGTSGRNLSKAEPARSTAELAP